MAFLSEAIRRLAHLSRRREFEANLADEIRFHLESRVADLEAAGNSRGEALAQARRELGPVALVCEDSRSAWTFRWLQDVAADLRYTLRAFRRNPAFALTAVLSLALGIGGTTAIVSALDAVFWRPLPVADPDSLVRFSISRDRRAPETDLPAAFLGRLRASGMFAGLIVTSDDGFSFAYDGRAERIVGEVVSPDYFGAVGVTPMLGQPFTAEVRNGQWAAEAVLSYAFWQQRFGGDPGVIGKTIRLNTYPFTIVGVTPPSFFGTVRGSNYELRVPILPDGRELAEMEEASGSPARWLGVRARLQPGVTPAQAESAADAAFQEFLRTTTIRRFQNAGLRHLRVVPDPRGDDEYTRTLQTPLDVLLVLVAILLLIACSNVANMMLARTTARAHEFAIRVSIGAGKLRLIRQALVESVTVSVIGGGVGVAVAYWGADVLFRFVPQGHMALILDLHPDRRVLLFALALSLVTGIVFGLAPAFEAGRGGAVCALKGGAAGTGKGARMRRVLVASEVAFSLVLLVAAGIFVRTLEKLRPTGYRADPARIALFTIKPQQEIYSDDQRRELARELLRRVSALPGVQSAAIAENGPLSTRGGSDNVAGPDGKNIRADSDSASPGFFDTVGIPRIAGRDFDARDKAGASAVVIVNQTLARMLYPDRNPIGEKLRILTGKQDGDYEIVGIAADTHYYDVHGPARPFFWFSIAQIPPYVPTLHVRTGAGDVAATIAAVRREFDLLDRGFPVFNIRTMATRMESALAGERMVANLAGAFGILAPVLAAVGLYGILAWSVSRRTREIGIRMALGANPGAVLSLVAREALVMVGIGLAAGTVLALAGARALAHYVPGSAAVDWVMVAASGSIIGTAAAAAIAVPAMRGCRIDPLRALRQD
jgi:predicted permease